MIVKRGKSQYVSFRQKLQKSKDACLIGSPTLMVVRVSRRRKKAGHE